MKIKYKISLIAAIMCIVCVGAMWAVNNFISLKYLEDTIQDKVLAEVRLKANDINTRMAKEKQNLEIIAERVMLAKDYGHDTLQATAATANIAEQNNEMVRAVQDINNAMQMNVESSNKLSGMIGQIKL